MTKNITNYRLTNACISISCNSFPNFTDQDFVNYLNSLPYLSGDNFYYIFQREISEAKGEH
jgi:hypothetical protein